MSNSISTELILVKELINKGKFEEALQHIKDIEQKENLSPEETLRTLKYKGRSYSHLGQFENALKITENLFQKSQDLKMPFFSLDALLSREGIFYSQQRFEEFFKTLKQHETLFESISREDSSEFQEREAGLLLWKAGREFHKGNLNLALDYQEKSLTLFEQVDPHSIYIPSILGTGRSYVYTSKGELDLALECDEKALSLIPEGEYFILILLKTQVYRNMGMIFHQKGDLNRALEYYKRVLELQKKAENPMGMWMNASYSNIIAVLLSKKNFNQAQNYLQQLKQFNEKYENKFGYLAYQIARASILKSSHRVRDLVKAEKILKKIVEENLGDISLSLVAPRALIDLCDLYLRKFRLTNQMEILDDMHPLIDLLQRDARYSNSYSQLALAKLFQAKLALLQINMVEARKLLTEAQKIADEHDLQLLAGAISREHDRLLEELKLWGSFKKTQTSVADRLKLASIDDVMERLQGRGAIDNLELVYEESILLLIMDSSGMPYFNHSFVSDWDIDGIFSAFMSAFNTFSSELFSKSIDRVKIGENTILINSVEPFLVCYVIKGQSYPASKKLIRFSEAIRENSEIWQALNNSMISSEMLELKNLSALRTVINEIFT